MMGGGGVMGEGKIFWDYLSPTQGSLWISVISRCTIWNWASGTNIKNVQFEVSFISVKIIMLSKDIFPGVRCDQFFEIFHLS